MSYRATCACGKAHAVTLADAGTSLRCECGQTVEIPPLHKLRECAGETPLSADIRLRGMLLTGEVPGGAGCARCGRQTDHLVRVVITCEQAETRTEADRSGQLGCFLLGLVLGWIVVHRPPNEQRVYGQDVVFTVPLRVCEVCDHDLGSAAGVRQAIRQIPIYAALLEKYPNARVTRAG